MAGGVVRCRRVRLPTKSWQYPHGRMAMQRRTLSTLQTPVPAMSLQAKWAWTGGAATAVMDLEGLGVGGGTVATCGDQDGSLIEVRLDSMKKSCGLAALVGLSAKSPALTIHRWEMAQRVDNLACKRTSVGNESETPNLDVGFSVCV